MSPSQRTTFDNEIPKTLGEICNTYDFIRCVLLPHLFAALPLCLGWFAAGLLTDVWPWKLTGASSFGFVGFWLFSLTKTGDLFQQRDTVPLWYGLAEWASLACVPMIFLMMLFGPDGKWKAGLAALSLFLFYFAVLSWRRGIRSIRFIVLAFFHETRELLHFYTDVLLTLIRGGVWLFLAVLDWAAVIVSSKPNQDIMDASMGKDDASEDKTLGANVIRILHLSDLHLRPSNTPSLENGSLQHIDIQKDLLRSIKELQLKESDNGGIGLVVITGDLTDTGSEEDFDEASRFLSELKSCVPDAEIFVVPGNHDLSINLCCWSIKSSVPKILRKPILLLGSVTRPFRKPFAARLRRFNRMCFQAEINGSANVKRVQLMDVPKQKLSVVLFNTGIMSNWIGSNAAGRFRRDDIADLESLEDRFPERLLILCHHHVQSSSTNDPFLTELKPLEVSGMRASGSLILAESLINRLKRTRLNTLILHGHTHIQRSYELTTSAGAPSLGIPTRCSPSALEGLEPGYLLHRWYDDGAIKTEQISLVPATVRPVVEHEAG